MTTVADRYELGEQLGAGGMATVWRAWDVRLERAVAIKFLSPTLAADSGFHARFQREAKQVAGLNHPNIVTIFDFGSDDDNGPYLVMELVDGESLAQRLNRLVRLSPEVTVEICQSVLAGLSEAHRASIET